MGFDYPKSNDCVNLKAYKEPNKYQFPCTGLLYMSVSYGAGTFIIKGGLYNKNGDWIFGVGVENANARSTTHSTVIPVYKGQYFNYSDLSTVTNGGEYISFVPNKLQ